jgi:hypothetical protein
VRYAKRTPSCIASSPSGQSDFYAIQDELDVFKGQLARLPTRREMAELTPLATLTAAALVLAGIEALFQ